MHRYIKGRDAQRTASPAPERSHTPAAKLSEADLAERRRLGAAARVDVPRTNVDNTVQRGQSPQRNMSRQRQQTTIQPTEHSQKAHLQNYNAFDTDAENADDTTITNFSDNFAHGNLRQQNSYATQAYHVEEDQGSVNGNESQFADGESEDDQESGMSAREFHMLHAAQNQAGVSTLPQNILPSPQSYPSTSVPDDDDEGGEEEGAFEGGYDDDDQYEQQNPELSQRVPYPTPQEQVQRPHPYAALDPFHQLRQAAPKKVMSDTSLPVRIGGVQSEITRPLSAKPVQEANQQQHHRTQPPLSTQPQRKGTQPASYARRPSTASDAETINERNFFGSRPSTAQQYPISPSNESFEPLLDYDNEELFKMDFSKLDQEDFDHNPRADPTKQPLSHLADSPLEDRLGAAFRELRPEDQSNFFASLSMREWDDAGGWFLTQFGDLLNRFKNARQIRRNIAQEFEDEIRKRNDAVSRKRQCVEKEITRIKGQGQKLLPDTPSRRRAATPAFTPRR
ncbi:hypothetical protein DIS24_g6323 [Lasiodiplodia hormozganensis]|uniref:Extracellular mutant protein 11 C-terminal domain-containing protein n=1 Tax=Lasiodiplodia hormozganensis TaxID=869390 RepID=A0AA40CVN6_9PEZI|nr:hypothetical protein DIS24_g6323 [Lasiodiplodia hormozganensis]